MTPSLSDLVGQELTWVRPKAFQLRYNLIAPDNSVIATFPVEMSGWLYGRHRLKALVPSGKLFPDGTLFLDNEEEREGRFPWSPKIVYVAISAVEQGPPLAIYKRYKTWHTGQLRFPDRREYSWDNVTFWGKKKVWKDSPPGTTAYVQISADSIIELKFGVVIYPQAAEIPELSLLPVLGLYNILIEDREGMKELGGIAGDAAGLALSSVFNGWS